MSMRKFFQTHRDEDYGQIQYLTAKCTRLSHDKVQDREFLVSRDRERKLQNDLESATAQLRYQEQLNMELRMKQDELMSTINQQQELVDLLQQRVVLLLEESSRDEELLRQVGSELHSLQSSEVKLEGLVDELHAEAHQRAALAESLHSELHGKTVQLEKLQETNEVLTEELRDLRSAHQKEVSELQLENEGSLRKLQEMLEQFEWLCQQQRYWMGCVKRFKDSLMEEREALLRQVDTLGKKTEELQKRLHDDSPAQSVFSPRQDAERSDSITSWDAEAEADLDSQVEKSSALYEELFNQDPV
ncbi:uncharacterized protein V6R79_012594 [Siganus canaliculatus]